MVQVVWFKLAENETRPGQTYHRRRWINLNASCTVTGLCLFISLSLLLFNLSISMAGAIKETSPFKLFLAFHWLTENFHARQPSEHGIYISHVNVYTIYILVSLSLMSCFFFG